MPAISSFKITSDKAPKPQPLPLKLAKFFGNIPAEKQWTMLVYGGSFSGKSTGMMKLAQELAGRKRHVLYCNIEENIDGGTIRSKLVNVKASSDYLWFNDNQELTLEQLNQDLKERPYRLCVIDSVSVVAGTKKEIEAWLRFAKKHPETSFIYISHADKSEKTFIGNSNLKHIPDITIRIENGEMQRVKNRYVEKKHNVEKLNIFENYR